MRRQFIILKQYIKAILSCSLPKTAMSEQTAGVVCVKMKSGRPRGYAGPPLVPQVLPTAD
jgi:hypothetical protein